MVADNKLIGQRIEQRREDLEISQESLGEMAGVSYQQIQKYEKGINKVSAERLQIIARSLNVPIIYFFKTRDEFVIAEERGSENYSTESGYLLSPQERELIECFRLLPGKAVKTDLLSLLKSLCQKEIRL